MQEVAGHSHQGFFSLSPRSAHPWPKPSLFLVLHVPRVLRGDSELPRVRLGEVGLGRRKIFGAVGVEMRLLALTQGVLSLWSPKGHRALRRTNVPSHRNLQPGHYQTPWGGPVGYWQGNTSVLIPQSSSCQGSSSLRWLRMSLIISLPSWCWERPQLGKKDPQLSARDSGIACPLQHPGHLWEPHPWSLGWQQWGLWGRQARLCRGLA